MKKMSRAIISTVLISALAFVSLASCKKDVPIDTTPATVKKATDELKLPEPTVTYDQEIYNLPNSVITDGRIVEVKWTVSDDLNTSKLKNNILTVNKDLLKNTVKLTANLSLNNQKKTKEFPPIELKPVTDFYLESSGETLKINIDTNKKLKYTVCGSSEEGQLDIVNIDTENKIIELKKTPLDAKKFRYEITDNKITLTKVFNRTNWMISEGFLVCDQFEKPIIIGSDKNNAIIIDYNNGETNSNGDPIQIEITKKDSVTIKEKLWNITVLEGQDGLKFTNDKDERTFLFKGFPFNHSEFNLE